jgi:hypothetical protein
MNMNAIERAFDHPDRVLFFTRRSSRRRGRVPDGLERGLPNKMCG